MTTQVAHTKVIPGTTCETEKTVQEIKERSALALGSAQRQPIPAKYLKMSDEELDRRVIEAKAKLGTRLVILGHHYQRDEVIKFADYRGDSFKLAQHAAGHPEAEFIIFCGVHFMAESADILTGPHQKVILPNMAAGCSMADMAPTDDVIDCWDELSRMEGVSDGLIPVTYMNCTAALKALVGENGGAVCTSSNARKVLEWAFHRGERVLFFPDQHLGRNTGLTMGFTEEQMPVWDPFKPQGGNSIDTYRRAKIILWKGHCSVHARFTVQQIQEARAKYPDIKIVVHPECTKEVVQAADSFGSTEQISKVIRESPPGSKWGVGTEVNLVHRLAEEHPDKLIFCLDPVVCPCSTMYRIHPAYLAWVLEGLVEGKVINQVDVPEETAKLAKLALDRMLAIP